MSTESLEAAHSNPTDNLEGEGRTCDSDLTVGGPTPGVAYPLKIYYCGECTMPIEYCEYSGKFDKCRQWLERNIPEMVSDSLQNLQVTRSGSEATTGGGDDGEEKKGPRKRGGKGQPKAEKPINAPQAASQVPITVQRAPRGKNKSVTVIRGLAAHGIDLKVASKFFASRFACGSSVTATDEIVIQGDVKDELVEVLAQKWPKQISENMIEDLGEQKR